MRQALLVVDMIAEFTTGRLGCAAARRVVPVIQRVLGAARRAGVPVIYVQDWHRSGDPELGVWGAHAVAGSSGARTHPALAPQPGEPVVRKRTLSGFFQTPLERLLRARRVETMTLVGVATEYCIQHTAADGHFRGFRVTALRDGTAGLTSAAARRALAYMHKAYGVRLSRSAAWCREVAR